MDDTTKTGKPVTDSRLCACVIEYHCNRTDTDLTPNYDYLTSLGEWWLILHDKDMHDDGTPKRKHYHLVLRKANRQRKSSFIADVAHAFNLTTEDYNLISCDIVLTKYLRDRLRYLCHLDDALKYTYDTREVKSNNKQLFAQAVDNVLTTDGLIDMLKDCHTRTDAIKALGIDAYCRYHYAIEDLFTDGEIWEVKDNG